MTRKLQPNPCKCGKPKYVGDGRSCQACQKKKATRQRAGQKAHDKRVEHFQITPEDYVALLHSQEGVCFICRRRPVSRRLAVDHCHAMEIDGKPTRESIRALLCKNCNWDVLGWLRDDVDALLRAITVVTKHPAQSVLKERE